MQQTRPGSDCGAMASCNRMNAVIGGSADCIAVHPSDMVAMMALGASIETIAVDGVAQRNPIAEFHRLPGSTPQLETVLAPGELVTAVSLPPPPGRQP